jgi:hemoglobin-like flavoprotein
LQSLEFVQACVPVVDKAKDTIIQEMESMVFKGLTDLVRRFR